MMKEGYKKTEIGWIPKEWEIDTLEKYCDVIDPHPSHRAPKEDDNGYPFIGIGDINEQGQIDLIKARKVSLEDVLAQRQTFELEEDDMGFGRVASIGKVVWFKKQSFPYAISPTMAVIKPKKCNPFYAYYFLSSQQTSNQFRMISAGSTRTSIGMKNLRLLNFVLPTDSEQQKIAEILSTVDEKIEVIFEQISQTQELKRGLMQRLLTKGIGHTRFKDSTLGKIPETWEVSFFNNIAENITTKYSNEEGRCIELEHIEPSTGRLLGYDGFKGKASAKNHFQNEDILFGKLRPYLKKFWFCEFNGACSTELMVFRAKPKTHPKYIYYIAQQDSFIENSVSKSFGTKMPRTSWKIISEFSLPTPPLPEQQKIANILSIVDEKLEVLQEKKQQYQELKRGLMQQLLTGKLRVTNLLSKAVPA